RETVADAELDIEAVHLEVDDAEDVVALLPERQEISDRAKIGVVLDRDCEILAKVPREPCVRCEGDLAVPTEAEINDRIDDEIIVALAPADDGADFHAPARVGKLRHKVLVFDVEAIKEIALCRIGCDEQGAQLHRVEMIAIFVDRPWNVEPGLEPIGHTVSEFRGGIERVVGNEATGKVRLLAADEGVVEVMLTGPFADVGNLRVV